MGRDRSWRGDGIQDAAPTGAAAEVRKEGLLDIRRPGGLVQGGQPAQDAGGAEAALAGAVRDERLDQGLPASRRETVCGGDGAPGDPAQGRDAGDAGLPVDQHGAAAALALRAAAVLDRGRPELIPERVEQRTTRVVQLDGPAVDGERYQQMRFS